MKEEMAAALAWGGVCAAGALWGVGALVAQVLIDGGISPWSLALGRFALGLPLLWWGHRRASSRGLWASLGRRERLQIVGTGAAMALNVSCWFRGIASLGAALPTVISICCAPVIVALVSVLRGYERLSLALVFALGLALTGVALLVVPTQGFGTLPQGYRVGLAWSFGSALCYALVVLGNARMPARAPAVTASAWGMGVAALCMTVVATGSGLTLPQSAGGWWGVAYTGVVTTSVAYLAFAWGARRLSPIAAVVGTLVEPLVAAMLAALCFGDMMSARQWVGAMLLGAAIWQIGRSTPLASGHDQGPSRT